MAVFFKTSVTWVVDFRYDGRPRRWFNVARLESDVRQQVSEQLQAWYGDRAQLVGLRHATPEEEGQYLRGEAPNIALCPTGRHGA